MEEFPPQEVPGRWETWRAKAGEFILRGLVDIGNAACPVAFGTYAYELRRQDEEVRKGIQGIAEVEDYLRNW